MTIAYLCCLSYFLHCLFFCASSLGFRPAPQMAFNSIVTHVSSQLQIFTVPYLALLLLCLTRMEIE